MNARLVFIALTSITSAASAQLAPPNPTPANAPPKGKLAIAADATIQNVLAGKDEKAPASGSLGFTWLSAKGRERFSSFITVAQAIDTLRGRTDKTFGRALLSTGGPSTAGVSLFSAEYQLIFPYGASNQSHGPRAYLAYAQTTWQNDSTPIQITNDLGIVSGGLRYVWVAINPTLPAPNTFSFTVEGGATFRSLTGDGADDATFMQRTIGTTKKFFWGPEFRATIQVRQLSAFFDLTAIQKAGGQTIHGLSGAQSMFGFSLDAPIYVF